MKIIKMKKKEIISALLLIITFVLLNKLSVLAGIELVYNRPPEANSIDIKTINFISGAASTLDIAIFSLSGQSFVDAILAAKNRGVKVRMVTETDNWNIWMDQLKQAGITIIKDSDGGGGSGFMHNKFIIRDSKDVLTGTYNFTPDQTEKDKNTIIILTNASGLASIYKTEFEQMYVSKKFGTQKSPQTVTTAVVDGITIEVYFSPKNNITAKLISAIQTCNSNLYFSIFTFTDQGIADAIKNLMTLGRSVRGVFDRWQADSNYSKDEYLKEAGADIRLDLYSGLLHDKLMAIDGGTTSDPLGIIGSFNYTGNANTSNDENILIIHSSTIANSIKSNIIYVSNNCAE